MVKTVKVFVVAIFIVGLSGSVLSSAQEVPAEKAFKNIQALKGVPASQITPLMDAYNKALGVNCEYCHVPGALEKADKPAHKAAVRDIQMTRDINQRYKMQVDCINCHQGKPKPPGAVASAGTPAVPGPKPAEPPKTTEPSKGAGKSAGGEKAEAAPPGDNDIIAAPTPLGNVPFPHERHSAAITDCTSCHHTGETNKCSVCHLNNRKTSAATKVTGYDAMHSRTSPRACWGCHVAQKTGPTTCAGCHKKG
jgi:hypothetical protein